MTDTPTLDAGTLPAEIVVEDVFPHSAETLWKALTDGALMARWIMEPTGFAPIPGTRFTFQTTPGGAWDGTIHCEVREAIPNRLLSYSWTSGHPSIEDGYGSPLDTQVTFTLTPSDGGTRLRMVHSGFQPRNHSAYEGMSKGWPTVLGRLAGLAGEPD
ncbi:MAG: SRPBCC domain-containing protein [Candidatus Andeanibacterium colombiense]|uniref:SRPBCC domain-containing protein n=1 Tax=Candidatus Andeanibacterium colombiense TaxID=3121345 RepID=A0AAJ6BNZ8_9SPHN|nr:MAG: SRPBCC domain-containing protein [Sphingomonadaceae bacterium]